MIIHYEYVWYIELDMTIKPEKEWYLHQKYSMFVGVVNEIVKKEANASEMIFNAQSSGAY